MSDLQQNGRDRLPGNEGYLNPGDHVINSAQGCKSFSLNEVARPVFLNHYYAGESMVTNRKLIRLEDSDISVENSMLNRQAQGGNCEYVEHSRNSLKMQPREQNGRRVGTTENLQRQDRGFHSESIEQNSLRPSATKEKEDNYILTNNCQARGGLHSEFIEPSRNSLKAMSVGKS